MSLDYVLGNLFDSEGVEPYDNHCLTTNRLGFEIIVYINPLQSEK